MGAGGAGEAPGAKDYGLTKEASADVEDAADTCGVNRVAMTDMNNTIMTAPIAAPSVRFTTFSWMMARLPFVQGERKCGAG